MHIDVHSNLNIRFIYYRFYYFIQLLISRLLNSQIHLMRNNSDALVKLCMFQTLFDHILLQPSMETFNVSILQSVALPKNEADRLKLLESRGRSDKEFVRILRKVSIWTIILPRLFPYC